MRLHSLGRCEIEIGKERITPDSERLFAFALLLIASRGREVQRGEIGALLWPTADDRQAGHSLRQCLYRLRHLGAQVESTRLSLRASLATTEADFAALLDGRADSESHRLGTFLPGYDPRFSIEFRDWLERQRNLVHGALRRRYVEGIASARSRGDWRLVEQLAHACLEIDCLNEEATLALAEAAVMHGSKARAIQILDQFLRDIGSAAREIRLPAIALRNRITRSAQLSVDPSRAIPFIGRAENLHALNTSLSLARSYHGGVHYIWGEPGIGKTRLVREFSEAAKLQTNTQVVTTLAHSTDQNRPLSCFLDALPTLLTLPGAIGCSPTTLERIHDLTARDHSTRHLDSKDPQTVASDNRKAIVDLLESVAEEQSVVLVIEDAQWLDEISRDLIQDLISWSYSRRFLLIVTSRSPDALMHWRRIGLLAVQEHQLGAFNDADSARLLRALRALLPIAITPDEEAGYIGASGGNPYHLTELVLRTAVETSNGHLESSLTALIRQRFDRLASASLRVLQACAVLGKHSTLLRLREVLHLPTTEFLEALDELERNGLADIAGQTFRCRHEIVASAALAQLGGAATRLLHLSVARTLDAESDDAPVAVLWDSAQHWLLAGEHQRAMQALRHCARHAMQLGSPAQAATLLERALTLPQQATSRRELMLEYINVLERGSSWQKLVLAIQEYEALIPCELREPHSRLEISMLEAQRRCGADPLELLARLRECTRSDAKSDHRIQAAALAFKICDNLCEADTAREIFASIQACLYHPAAPQAERLECELIYHCSVGSPDAAMIAARQLIAIARTGDESCLLRALSYGALAFRVAGETESARRHGLEACALASARELWQPACFIAAELHDLALHLGDLSDAETWMNRSLEWGRRASVPVGTPSALIQAGRLAAYQQRWHDAEELLEEAFTHDIVKRYPRTEVVALGFLLYTKLRGRNLGPSDDDLVRLLQLFSQTAAFSVQDSVAHVIWELLRAVGRGEEATVVLNHYIHEARREKLPLLPQLNAALQREQARG